MWCRWIIGMGSFRLRGLCTDATSALRKTALGSPERFFFVLCFWCIPCFTPCRGRLTFFVLPKKVSKERRARDGDFPLNLCRREGKGKTRFAQTVSLPFSSVQQKFKAPSRAPTAKQSEHDCSRNQQHNAKQSEQQQQQQQQQTRASRSAHRLCGRTLP